MIVIGYYTTGSGYEREAERLAKSLDRVSMSYEIEAIPGPLSWYAATAQKPIFCRKMRKELHGGLLYIDVDAFVHENCEAFFDEMGERGIDFAAHWFQGPSGGYDRTKNADRMLSGTLFLGDTDGASRLIDAWCGMNSHLQRHGCTQGGGQKNLWYLTTCLDLQTERLPGRFCRVFDKAFAYPEDEPVIIEHLIASRENRGESKGKVHAGRQARIRQLDEMLAIGE